jgi:Protein of unknown function (DUF3363)
MVDQDLPPRLKVLSAVRLEELPTYDGPTWLDQSLASKKESPAPITGFGGRLEAALEERRRWLARQGLGERRASGEWVPEPELRRTLERREQARIEQTISRELKAPHLPLQRGLPVVGVYVRAIATPTRKLALIHCNDTFTLAPWTPAVEAYKGRMVTGSIGQTRITWSHDRGHGLARGQP